MSHEKLIEAVASMLTRRAVLTDNEVQELGDAFLAAFGSRLSSEQKLLFCQRAGLRPRITEEDLRKQGGIPVYELALIGGRAWQGSLDDGRPSLVETNATWPIPDAKSPDDPQPLIDAVQELLKSPVTAKVDRGQPGYWFLDLTLDGHTVTVEHCPGVWGVSCSAPGRVDLYGEQADESWGAIGTAAGRIAWLLAQKKYTKGFGGDK